MTNTNRRIERVRSTRATIHHFNRIQILYSYNTPVAVRFPDDTFLVSEKGHSVTTSGHKNEFLGRNWRGPEDGFKRVPQDTITAIDKAAFHACP